jgi:hypothetical protein
MCALLAIRILTAKRIFKELSQDGGWTDFSKNLRASPFNEDLSIDTAFSQLPLAEQYRPSTFKVLAKSISEQFTFLRNIFWQEHKCCKSTAQRCSQTLPCNIFLSVQSRVSDPDWIRIRIQSGQWIRIRIRNPDPDPGGQN